MKKINVCVITFPISQAGVEPLSNFVEILRVCANKLYLITGNAGYDFFRNKFSSVFGVHHISGKSTIAKIIKYAFTQLRIINKVLQFSLKVDAFIFFIGGPSSSALIIAKLMRKQVVLVLAGSDKVSLRLSDKKLSAPISLIQAINLVVCDKIVVYSRNIINEFGLQRYANKIYIAHRHFLDFEKFTVTDLRKRDALVGYVGRLSKEKGTINYLEAVAKIEPATGIHFLIAGDGLLRPQVESFVKKDLTKRIKFVGWVDHDDLPAFLNELKLLVLPSYTEGLPNVMLEAMACGTPVLAMPVGSIPDVIRDCETGFLLKSNDPKHIAEKIIELLNKPELLEKVSANAYVYVRENFSFEKTIAVWQKIIAKFV
uniref:Glycosyltransferase family 1 protein n=1 Tax=Candidatus Methanomethylicus mesodigestus TaxID=1867258 RepID=A0A7C3EX29_9CREN